MYVISLVGKHKMLFAKEATMTLAKERANKELQSKPDPHCGGFDYAEIYNQEDKSTIQKNGIGCDWVKAG